MNVFICTDDGWAAMSGVVVENGKNGSDGNDDKDGEKVGFIKNGTAGALGTSCGIESDVDGVVTIKCGTGDYAVTMTPILLLRCRLANTAMAFSYMRVTARTSGVLLNPIKITLLHGFVLRR